MESDSSETPANEWNRPYRGYRLSINADREVWWQVYNGTERLYLDSFSTEIIDRVIGLKNTGGRIHITEEGDVLTRVEQGREEYQDVWVGECELRGELVPEANRSASVPVRPDNLSPGDLWPSIYEGARFSFREQDEVWWANPETKRRHYLEQPLPREIALEFNRYKSQGGSFRVTPWGDVITLIPFHPKPKTVEEQFSSLPDVVRNIIRLRKERGVEMLPIYIGNVGEYTFEIGEPQNLSDPLSEEEEEQLESWARNLGRTSSTTLDEHQTENPDEDTEFDDDPQLWGEEDSEGGDEE